MDPAWKQHWDPTRLRERARDNLQVVESLVSGKKSTAGVCSAVSRLYYSLLQGVIAMMVEKSDASLLANIIKSDKAGMPIVNHAIVAMNLGLVGLNGDEQDAYTNVKDLRAVADYTTEAIGFMSVEKLLTAAHPACRRLKLRSMA